MLALCGAALSGLLVGDPIGVPAAARPASATSQPRPDGPLGPVAAPATEALARIAVAGVEAHLAFLASPALEGRDSPSRGLELAFEHGARALAAAGFRPAPDSAAAWRRGAGEAAPPAWAAVGQPDAAVEPAGAGSSAAPAGLWLRPYQREKLLFDRVVLHTPVPEATSLELTGPDGRARLLTYGTDFVPLAEYTGSAAGELVFAGFAIDNDGERYDDLAGLDLAGKVAVLVSGEPRHKRLFGGPDVTAEASVWNKLDTLARRGAAGALVVRRPPELARGEAAPELSYRWTRATWLAPTNDRVRATLPALEVSPAAGEALLGFDPLAWAEKVDRSGKPAKATVKGRTVRLTATTRTGPAVLHNLVGYMPGRDPERAGEVVIVGAHFDHIGVDPRERVGPGADDNASGAAALLEVAAALALARPARSVLIVGFSAEEDGLIGSQAFVADLPFPKEQVVAMVNLDMIGRGDPKHVVALGFRETPLMGRVVERARALGRTGVTRIEDCGDTGLFQRSDHHSFHVVGIPTVFFFENYPIEANRDYHTWRDTLAEVSAEKVCNTARLAFLTAWTLAESPERLPRTR